MKAISIRAAEGANARLSRLILCLLIASALAFASVANVRGQQNTQPPPTVAKTDLGPSADSIRPYKPAGRDPFKRSPKPPANTGGPGGKRREPVQTGFPALEVRRAQFRQMVEDHRNKGLTEPSATRMYLVSELVVTGVFHDDQGFGAFVQAQPTGSMFFVRKGEQCYNGEILRIEGDESDVATAKVLFRESTYVEVNGKQSTQVRVVAKLPTAPQRQ